MKRLLPLLLFFIVISAYASGYRSTDMHVWNGRAGIRLGATLVMPGGGQNPHAAVVLVSGSGAQNRDEEILGHRPFKAIAEFLGARGYAVLRMDDRGTGESGGDAASSTVVDVMTDVGAAFAALDSLLGRDIPKGVIGHSEGGSVAVRCAADSACAFIVTLSAPAWKGDSIIMSQACAAAVAMGGNWPAEGLQRRLLNLVQMPLSAPVLEGALMVELGTALGEEANVGSVRRVLEAQARVMSSPAYRSLVCYNPAADIAAVRVPWLALYAGKDMQILPANAETVRGLNESATVLVLDGHNHLFLECGSGMVDEYAALAGDISVDTLDAIAAFLDALFLR